VVALMLLVATVLGAIGLHTTLAAPEPANALTALAVGAVAVLALFGHPWERTDA